MSDPNPISIAEAANSSAAEKLRAKAARYRSLAETLFDPTVLAVVMECARELEAEAKALEERKVREGAKAG